MLFKQGQTVHRSEVICQMRHTDRQRNTARERKDKKHYIQLPLADKGKVMP